MKDVTNTLTARYLTRHANHYGSFESNGDTIPAGVKYRLYVLEAADEQPTEISIDADQYNALNGQELGAALELVCQVRVNKNRLGYKLVSARGPAPAK